MNPSFYHSRYKLVGGGSALGRDLIEQRQRRRFAQWEEEGCSSQVECANCHAIYSADLDGCPRCLSFDVYVESNPAPSDEPSGPGDPPEDREKSVGL